MNFDGKNPQRELLRRLTGLEIIKTKSALPKPDAKYYIPEEDARLKLYRVKTLHSKTWLHDGLKRLVLDARGSYYRYGHCPPMDTYDSKAAVYIVSINYPGKDGASKNSRVEECVSMRFVPGDGTPLSNEDLKHARINGRPIGELIRDRLFGRDPAFLSKIVSISRLCAITPYNAVTGQAYGLKLSHTFPAFLIMNCAFKTDCQKIGRQISFVTGLFRNELIQKSLTVRSNNEALPVFLPAYKALHLNTAGAIKISRHTLAHRFPAYFLNIHELLILLTKLISSKQLSPSAIDAQLKISGRLTTTSISAEKVGLLRPMLTSNGRIQNSILTGNKLWSLINKYVNDGPEMKIMNAAIWFRDIHNAIKLKNIS